MLMRLNLNMAQFDSKLPQLPGIQTTVAFLIFSILILSVCCLCTRICFVKPSTSLEALLTIMTPTCVAWPADYHVLFKHSTSTRSMTIKICVSHFLRNIGAGTVELKNVNDLPHIFCRRLRAYGWLVSFDVDFFLWTAVLRWILVSQIPGCATKYVFLFTSDDSLSIFSMQCNCYR